MNIEIKTWLEPDYDGELRIFGLLPTFAHFAGQRPLMTSSFNPLTVQALAASLAGVPSGLLHGPGLRVEAASEFALQFGASVLSSHLDAQPLDAETVSVVRDTGLAVMVWVVDDPAEAVRQRSPGLTRSVRTTPGGLSPHYAITDNALGTDRRLRWSVSPMGSPSTWRWRGPLARASYDR